MDARPSWIYRRSTSSPLLKTSLAKFTVYLVGLAWDRFERFDYEVAAQPGVDSAEIEAKLAQIDAEIAAVEADETLSEYRRAQALTVLDAEREKLLDTLTEAGTVVKHIGREYLGVLFQLKGEYGLRKEPTPDHGYQWVSDPQAEGHWLDNLADVKACREFLRKMLGEQVTVRSVNGSKTVPVEERVRLAAA